MTTVCYLWLISKFRALGSRGLWLLRICPRHPHGVSHISLEKHVLKHTDFMKGENMNRKNNSFSSWGWGWEGYWMDEELILDFFVMIPFMESPTSTDI